MADNVTIPATGSGTATPVIATDDVSGVQFQRVKLDAGGDGATTPILAGNGVAASALRVTLASDGTGTVAATQSGSWATTISGTVAISAAALPLPSGASTAAKQPALGTAGTASADVITVQGVASMVALKVDGSGVTQPISGTVTIQDGGGSVTVDGTVSVSGLVPGTSATSLGKAEDAAAGDGDTGVMMLAIRKDTAATTVGADGDYHPLEVDANGRLHVNGSGVTQPVSDAGGSLTVDGTVAATQSGTWTVTGTGGTFPVTDSGGSLTVDNGGTFAVQSATAGDAAHDAADSGNPVKIGAKAETSPKGITAVADGDRTDLLADSDGMLMVKLNTSGADFISERVSNTDGASTAFTNFGAVASTKNAVTVLSVFRTDAGTTLIYVDFRDGTAGAVLYSLPIPAGGGVVLNGGGAPLFKTSANTALAFDVSAATSTVYISASGYQTKV